MDGDFNRHRGYDDGCPSPGGRKRPALCKKEVPRITFENISPPFDQYDYFQNHLFFPFEYDASSFSLINAWWLAEASTLVYSDAAYAWQRLRQAGFKQVQFIEHAGTYCFVAANEPFRHRRLPGQRDLEA